MMQHDDRAREIRRQLVDVRLICRQLGLDEGARPQAHGLLVRCPWHADRTPSLSVRRGPDGTLALKCHGCDRGGDVFHLVAAAHGLDARRDFPEVLKRAAELAGADPDPRPWPPSAFPAGPLAERTYPPRDELVGLWDAARPVLSDPPVATHLRSRGLDPAAVDRLELARALPVETAVPRWASFQQQPWSRIGHRLLVPLFDSSGDMRSVRAWRVTDHDSPKRLPPAGHRLGGLVLSDGGGRALLRGEAGGRREVVFVEGEPNMMSWALWLDRNGHRDNFAVFGVFAGSWTPDLAARVPDGATVYVRTDHDEAGERYAETINATLGTRCDVRRLARSEAA